MAAPLVPTKQENRKKSELISTIQNKKRKISLQYRRHYIQRQQRLKKRIRNNLVLSKSTK
jgi:hypothetical protein